MSSKSGKCHPARASYLINFPVFNAAKPVPAVAGTVAADTKSAVDTKSDAKAPQNNLGVPSPATNVYAAFFDNKTQVENQNFKVLPGEPITILVEKSHHYNLSYQMTLTGSSVQNFFYHGYTINGVDIATGRRFDAQSAPIGQFSGFASIENNILIFLKKGSTIRVYYNDGGFVAPALLPDVSAVLNITEAK